jgi:hypothetical protein
MTNMINENNGVFVQGHIKIHNPETGEVLVDKKNAIHYENMSIAPNTTGTNAGLYNQTFTKVVDDRNADNTDPTRNKIETRHISGTNYTDILVTCLLDYGEPNGQDAFDTASDENALYVFDELGLRSANLSGVLGDGQLLTHVIFHPVQKSLNRLIQVDYTVRVQSLSGGNS